VEREESDLYGLPLDEFVPARTELERQLRKSGDRERAAAVKKLPKPSVAAWAVNQASRSQPKARRELLAASDELREVQQRLLARKATGADLEKAAGRQRAAIDDLADAAAGLLTSDGKALADATLARVRETLAAVAADDELAGLVEAGTLDRERRPAGLGFSLGPADAPAAPRKAPQKESKAAKEEPTKAAAKAKKEAAKAKKEREKLAKRREQELRAAREAVKAANAAEREAERRRKAAERDARKAAEALERAQRAAEQAAKARESAEAELDRLS
jgi:hypothetical protein